MKSISILLAIILLCGIFLPACSDETEVIDTLAESNVTVVEESQDFYIAQAGGELDIAIPSETDNWNPLKASDEDLINMLGLVYETPLSIDKEGRFVPNLVETWDHDETGKVYTFNLRKGITFHNGDAFNADDILYTITKIYDIAGSNISIYGYNDSAPASGGDEDLTEGEDTAPAPQRTSVDTRYTIYSDIIASINKVDEYTIEITMTKPGREALYFMTFPVLSDSSDADTTINGTGAYMLSERGENGEVILKINDAWWKTAPYISQITAHKTSSLEDKISRYSADELNLITTNSISSGKLKAENETQIVDYSTNYYDCIVPNLFKSALKDVNARKAISYAIDRRDIISSVLLNHAVAAEIPISPSFFAYDVKYKLYEYDASTSRDLLEALGYATEIEEGANNLELTMIVPNEIGYEYRLEVVRVIEAQLADVGIILNIELLNANTYLSRLNSGDFDLAYVSYYMDSNPDLTFMLSSGADHNYGNIASPDLDAILESCSTAVSENDVIVSYDQLQQYFIDKVPQIGLFYRMFSVIADYNVKDISGMYENRLYGNISKWSIDLK